MTEKGNETRWNTAQAMRLAAHLPPKFWEFAERMASKLISLIVKEGQEITPFEKLYEIKPSMNLIRTFGCHAFAYIPYDQHSKIDPKSQAAINLGPAENMNGFLLYDPIAMKTFQCSNILFDEYAFGIPELKERIKNKKMPSYYDQAKYEDNEEIRNLPVRTRMDDLKNWDAGLMDDPPYEHDEKYE